MFDELIDKSSVDYFVPADWIRAVIDVESNWDTFAYRAEPRINDASYGLMQLLNTTARSLGFTGQPEELYKPEINIPLGAQLLGQLRSKYGDDFRRIYSAYNSGSPDKWMTSSEVAKNTQRALDALERWVMKTAEEIVAVTPAVQTPALVALLVLILMWAWGGKRR